MTTATHEQKNPAKQPKAAREGMSVIGCDRHIPTPKGDQG
jgi:hypothetical protein